MDCSDSNPERSNSVKFQFSIARLLLASAAFAFVLGIMKPLRLAGNPLVLIAALAVAGIALVANRDQFRLKGTIAIALQVFNISLFVALSYLKGPWDAPVRWQLRNEPFEHAITWLMSIFFFPLGCLDLGAEILLPIALALNCYLWAQCICWIIGFFMMASKKMRSK
jgi:hypothetical protein